jgi:hypothetical protein
LAQLGAAGEQCQDGEGAGCGAGDQGEGRAKDRGQRAALGFAEGWDTAHQHGLQARDASSDVVGGQALDDGVARDGVRGVTCAERQYGEQR